MSITTVGRHLVHYEALGRGEPVLFVHGWLGSWRYWWPAMQALSVHHRTFAIDLWGFGDSSKGSELYELDTYVALVDDFVDRLGILTPLALVGHGLGAAVALRYANRYPSQVKRLVVVALPIEGEYLNERLGTMPADAFLQRYLARESALPELERETHKMDPVAVRRLAVELAGTSFEADLQDVSCQTLLVYGEEDNVVAAPNGSFGHLHAANGSKQLVTLPGCSHFVMLEEPARFNRLVLDFLMAETAADVAPKEMWQRKTR
jgi:pimeloyl-ACP methyl ester carboxylesterase